MKKRNYFVDLMRFVCSLLIMSYHLYILGCTGSYFGRCAWVWVDYFFMITGFFTAKHFSEENRSAAAQENLAKEALIYTFRKITVSFPYYLVSMAFMYAGKIGFCFLQGNYQEIPSLLLNFPLEILLIPSSGIGYFLLTPIWFLSAMAIVLPLIIYLMRKHRDAWVLASWLLPLLYYGCFGINGSRNYPNDMVRAFVSIALGTFLYFLAGLTKNREYSKSVRCLLTAAELVSFITAVMISVSDTDELDCLILLFSVNLFAMLSQQSYTAGIGGKVCRYLGALSLPVFIFHWPIGKALNILFADLTVKTVLYYVLTLLVSILSLEGRNRIKQMHWLRSARQERRETL